MQETGTKWHSVLDTASAIMQHLEATLWKSPHLRFTVNGFWRDSCCLHRYPPARWPDDQPRVFFLWMMAVKDTVRRLHNDILSPWFLTGSLIVTNDLVSSVPCKVVPSARDGPFSLTITLKERRTLRQPSSSPWSSQQCGPEKHC